MFNQKRIVLILLALLSLAACGQKGELYLPEEQAAIGSVENRTS